MHIIDTNVFHYYADTVFQFRFSDKQSLTCNIVHKTLKSVLEIHVSGREAGLAVGQHEPSSSVCS